MKRHKIELTASSVISIVSIDEREEKIPPHEEEGARYKNENNVRLYGKIHDIPSIGMCISSGVAM